MPLFSRLIARGLMVGLPVILTIAILVWLLRTIEEWLAVPLRYLMDSHYVPGMGLALGLALTIALGIIASTWIGRRALGMIGLLMERLPLAKTIYGALKDVFQIFRGSGSKDAFEKAVVVEWGGRRFLGFITRDNNVDLPEGLMQPDDVVVYLPMGYQIGGFPVVVARDQVTPIDMTVDAALRFALTAGMSAKKED